LFAFLEHSGVEQTNSISTGTCREAWKDCVDYNPWDTGTRRETLSDMDAVAAMVRAGVALESEGALPATGPHDTPDNAIVRAVGDALRKRL
jgi:hypothetical protein